MLYQEMNIWAARKGFRYIARHDEKTIAMNTEREADVDFRASRSVRFRIAMREMRR